MKIQKMFYVVSYSDNFHELWAMNWVVKKFLGVSFVKCLGYDISAFENKEEAVTAMRIHKAAFIQYMKRKH